MMDDLTLDFAELFAGRDDALGFGAGRVERRRVTIDDYHGHLMGRGEGIGIFPLRDDGTVRFAAIDLDEPNFELATAMQLLIPGMSWVEESRSGNAHVWVFFEEDAPAWAARAVLRGATEAVGRTDVEIFPKQDQLREGMVGNYINLPLHGQSRPIRNPLMTAHQTSAFNLERAAFVERAMLRRTPVEAFVKRARMLGGTPPEERDDTAEWGTAPVLHECASYIIKNRETNPIQEGGRHQVLFHLAVQLLNYAEMTQPEAWNLVKMVNASARPPLDERELRRMFNNAVNGRYTFTGCDDPVMAPYVSPDCPIAKGQVGR